MATLSTAHTATMAAQRYRLPYGFIPRYMLEEIRAFAGGFPWGLDHMFRALPPRLSGASG